MLYSRELIDLYNRTYSRRWRTRLGAVLLRRSPRLLDLAALAAKWKLKNQYSVGQQSVPIRQVVGSENYHGSFDAHFRPRTTDTRSRWLSVAKARLSGIEMPPVELIQVGDRYFVRDGHHRISVASALGQQEIDAVVTLWNVEERTEATTENNAATKPAVKPALARILPHRAQQFP